MKINIDKITIFNNNDYLEIYPKEHKVICEDKTLTIEDETIKELIKTIRSWNHEYYDGSYLDGPMFEVKVYSEGRVDTFKGVRALPENYSYFSELIRSIHG